ncbi:MAG: CPXCG motif-containing cysteine-rich protein [Halothece sp. Uz-M2-17]|nr:CPXCG motif-containing cysteine-rich protein [Halothece sp. Uz-M2-17]
MENTTEFICAFCGEANPTIIDLTAGYQQSYVEDCQVCCNPNVLYIQIDEITLEVEVETDCES